MSYDFLKIPPELEEFLSKAASQDVEHAKNSSRRKVQNSVAKLKNELDGIKLDSCISNLEFAISHMSTIAVKNEKRLERLAAEVEQETKEYEHHMNHPLSSDIKIEMDKLKKYEEYVTTLKENLNGLGLEDKILTLEPDIQSIYEKTQTLTTEISELENDLSKYKNFPTNVLEGKEIVNQAVEELRELKSKHLNVPK